MSTDYQQAREALGLRLRELRLACPDGRLTGAQLADRLGEGWTKSRVSKLENGRQTATAADLRGWATATGNPEAYDGLVAQLRGFESHIRSWRRQLSSGHRPVQEAITAEHDRTRVLTIWENVLVPGMLQTADYARHVLTRHANLMQSPRDTEDAVRARVLRQQGLSEPGRKYRILMWEGALHALVCPPSVLAAQLDRLVGLVGLDTLELGVVPFTASLKIFPGNGFWIYDSRRVVVEDWHAELWLDDDDSVATYMRVWDTLRESAVYGVDAQSVISRARRSVQPRA
ncbi:helix-turn-helix domain-containing protein [Streptomyces acidiscabies]|uniref:Helix-turn-helix transcriptional regulator n=1 Tax=Streptomyces acidiscabies TaxID=42234 RepID=A0ABU4LVT2_9ACTN|nr:helix-turn-helix transcriptional regulator [Streptomyces acidiscabies]MDX3019849.1 helix-turn-helix transcriptional regulator [Streptomyces acidiscabies]